MYSDLGLLTQVAAGLLALGLATPCRADGPAAGTDAVARDALHYLGRLDRPDSLEPAGSHGSMGMDIGAGVDAYAGAPDNPVLRSLMGGSAQATGSDTAALAVPRAWLVKGLPVPVDLGLSVGSPAGAGFTQVSGTVQWTLFEAFALPAVAVRASYGRLFGLPGTTLTSAGAEAVASYGFLRYVTVYGSAGATQHQGRLNVRSSDVPASALIDGQAVAPVAATWTEPVRSVGIKLLVLPPFIAVTGEAEMAGSIRDYAAKLSIDM